MFITLLLIGPMKWFFMGVMVLILLSNFKLFSSPLVTDRDAQSIIVMVCVAAFWILDKLDEINDKISSQE